jgi:hypothetical protein
MTADELGLDAPSYATEYTFRNTTTGVDTIVLSSDYLKVYNEESFKSTYEIVTYDGKEVKISDGYEPRIMDLIMENTEGEDLTDSILANKGYTFLHISKDIEAAVYAGAPNQLDFNSLANDAMKAGCNFYGLTNAGAEYNNSFSEDYSTPYGFLSCDQIELKIMIRSNPGLMLLKDGVVVDKWAWRDIPDFSDLHLP